jgi:nucleotide-binding universal stress UspA family protein
MSATSHSEPIPARRRILVGIRPWSDASRALADAIALADGERATLTLLSAVPEPPPTVWFCHQILLDPRRAGLQAAESSLQAAVASVPAHIAVETIVARGRPAAALLRELRKPGYAAVFVGARCAADRRRWARRALSARLQLRSPVPVLSCGASA